MKKIKAYLEAHPVVVKMMVYTYIVFAGCLVFPLGSEMFPLDFNDVYLAVASYGVIAISLVVVLGEGREVMVYITTFLLTNVGMLCRYALEFGETSNSYNFTLFNIIVYLLIIPIFTTVAYHFIVDYLKKDFEKRQ